MADKNSNANTTRQAAGKLPITLSERRNLHCVARAASVPVPPLAHAPTRLAYKPISTAMSVLASNEESYLPPEFADAAFIRWALRVTIKLRNLPPNAPERLTRRALFGDGTPSQSWAAAYGFMATMKHDSYKCSAR